MRILIARNVIYSYLLHGSSLRSILSTYLFRKIQREPQLQGFLTETAFQEVLNTIESFNKSKAEQDQTINLIKQTLQRLPSHRLAGRAFQLSSIESEEIACALQNGLDALITHDPTRHQLAANFLIWTVGEFLNQYRRSKLDRSYLEPNIETSVHALLNRAIPILDGCTGFLSFQTLTEHFFQESETCSNVWNNQETSTALQEVIFGNEFQINGELLSQYSNDDLLNGLIESDELENESDHTTRVSLYDSLRSTDDFSDCNLQAEAELQKAEAIQAKLKFLENNFALFLALILVFVGLQATNQAELIMTLEQQLSSQANSIGTEVFTATLNGGFTVSLFNYLLSHSGIKQQIKQFLLTDSQFKILGDRIDKLIDLPEDTLSRNFKDSHGELDNFRSIKLASEYLAIEIDRDYQYIQNGEEITKSYLKSVPEVEFLTSENVESNISNYQDIATNSSQNNVEAPQLNSNARLLKTENKIGSNSVSQERRQKHNEAFFNFEGVTATSSETPQSTTFVGSSNLETSSSIEVRVGGTDNDDRLIVPMPEDGHFNSGRGNDTIVAGSGDDLLNGDRGSDILTGGLGADTFITGYGISTITDFNAAEGDRINIVGEVSDYRLAKIGSRIEIRVDNPTVARLLDIPGGQLIAVVNYASRPGLNFVSEAINQPVMGSSANDRLIGGTGSNLLWGDAGKDILIGGSGQLTASFNLLEGGEGADTFVLGNSAGFFHTAGGFSTITDFDASQGDKVRLAGNSSLYTFDVAGANTEIRIGKFQLYSGELIGVVKNETNLNVSTDVEFGVINS